jgi:ParB/RepB/Spo0J family partition protein
MQIQLMPIDALKPYANNPRDNKKAVDKVAESLKTYGWQQPIVVDQDNTIIVGHTRWLAAKKLGMAEVPVHIADNLTPEQIRAYRLADNRLAEEADWDFAILKQEFSALQEISDLDLSITGFTDNEISKTLTFDVSKMNRPFLQCRFTASKLAHC